MFIQKPFFPPNTPYTARFGGLPLFDRRITVRHFDIADLPAGYIIVDHTPATIRTVPLHHITPTQQHLNVKTIRAYVFTYRHTDSDGILPLGIRFQNDTAVYLVNGHHRWYAARCRGERTFMLHIRDIPFTMELAMKYPGLSAVWQTTKTPAIPNKGFQPLAIPSPRVERMPGGEGEGVLIA